MIQLRKNIWEKTRKLSKILKKNQEKYTRKIRKIFKKIESIKEKYGGKGKEANKLLEKEK